MSYRVHWTSNAEDDFTQIWLSSRVRHLLSDFIERTERHMEIAPETVGESREPEIRIVCDEGLVLQFVVDRQQKVVVIFEVRLLDRR